jgi:pSer/pThr/pTyr-binding forkhead associated (FHA) protein
MARLVVLSEGYTGRTYELKVDKTTIGRVEDNSFQIPDASVSSHHCEILLRGSDVVVKDLDSTNGSFINGEPITEAVLKPGQVLRLGQIDVRLEEGPPPGTAGKQQLDKTRVIKPGVKVDDLERSTGKFNPDTSEFFKKKSNRANKIFIIIGAALFVVILALILVAVLRLRGG